VSQTSCLDQDEERYATFLFQLSRRFSNKLAFFFSFPKIEAYFFKNYKYLQASFQACEFSIFITPKMIKSASAKNHGSSLLMLFDETVNL